jgi:hypothetical protein
MRLPGDHREAPDTGSVGVNAQYPDRRAGSSDSIRNSNILYLIRKTEEAWFSVGNGCFLTGYENSGLLQILFSVRLNRPLFQKVLQSL